MELFDIHFFQFDNLVRSRIPFLLLHDGVDFAELYRSIEREHLERYSLQVDFAWPKEKLLSEAEKKGFPKMIPVVLLAREPGLSREWVEIFEGAGYMNVHLAVNGWKGLKQEAQVSH